MALREIVSLRTGPQVTQSLTGLKVADVRMSQYGRVNSAFIYCRALTGTVTVDIQKNDATILSAVVTPVADAQTAGAIVRTSAAFASGDRFSVKVTTAATSTLDDLNVTLTLG